MPTQRPFVRIALAFATMALPATAFSEQQSPPTMHAPAATMEMSPNARKDIADMYRKLADCLEAGTSIHDCMQAVMKDCPVIAKTGHCPIVEGMGPMSGPHRMSPEDNGATRGSKDMH